MPQIGDRDLELAVLPHNGIDARFDQAVAGGLVRRGFDLGLGGKGHCKALVRVLVFPPALRTGWGACGNYGDDEGDEAHFLMFSGEIGSLPPRTSYAVVRTIGSSEMAQYSPA